MKIALFLVVLLCMSSAYAGFHVRKDGKNAIEIVSWSDYGKGAGKNRYYVTYENTDGKTYSARMSKAEFEDFKQLVNANRKKWNQKQNKLDKADDKLNDKMRDGSLKWMEKYGNHVVQITDYEELGDYVMVHVVAVGNSGKKVRLDGLISRESFDILRENIPENKRRLLERQR